MTDKHIHLNVFVPTTGHHEASWLYSGSQPERLTDVDYYREIAAIAERGKFDSLFLADQLAIGRSVKHVAQGKLEPLTLLSALAGSTSHIGLIATASTTYSEPYNLARQFASLDHISGGRAGWNIVTSWSAEAAGNFGLDQRNSHTDRYRRATEYVEVVHKLWDSWEDDARVLDRTRGIYADTARIHAIDHQGETFRVRGPLDVPRSPQGNPVLVQAGSSDEGRGFAARYAEAIFTAQQDLSEAKDFYADVKRRALAFGRDPDDIKILPGLSPILGSTDTEARALEEELDDLTLPVVGLKHLSQRFDGFDFSVFPLDERIPIEAFPRPETVQGAQSRSQVILNIVEREKPTLRQLLRRLAGGRGHKVLAGTPKAVANHIQLWVEQRAADGFNIMPAFMPGGLSAFVDEVVPILQARGLFRRDYTGRTLREHYGLTRPESRYARSA
ncbi:FMN-dependent oxidoreductase (nitrilotriacetate monooxygenase family) [Ancylobacter aquaticus]|uniref:FMN-dependent oxidoreductase (Nitrilotriacetate monooxygenase family) n=1 Tax=Ancylobacter aquaticus TaxID=100 RepID=A0A4R1HJL8_ANCAQ|nr:LLM class flavin-dependent oxidoreductase [Ancylobacter aquaticus]TCK19729.1 FMN-dependent oxidoreductase (nitrilotriacetate monooxygenase family) [Ancylobacter aquaticus]